MISVLSDEQTLFQLLDIVVRQSRRTLLSGLSCHLSPGELVAVTGPSGCGKTTLLRMVAGLIGDGRGLALRGRSPQEIGWPDFRRQVVLVAQQPVLSAGSVEQTLARPFLYHHVEAEFSADRARDLLDRLHLRDVELTASARELSVGQQQRVCLVRSLLLKPSVLLLDEPTSALDAAAATEVADLVSELAATDGLAALVVTHDQAAARRWCHRVLDLVEYTPEAVS